MCFRLQVWCKLFDCLVQPFTFGGSCIHNGSSGSFDNLVRAVGSKLGASATALADGCRPPGGLPLHCIQPWSPLPRLCPTLLWSSGCLRSRKESTGLISFITSPRNKGMLPCTEFDIQHLGLNRLAKRFLHDELYECALVPMN